MNTESSEIDSKLRNSEPDEPAERPKRGGGALAGLALLVALAALAGTAWMWWQDQASVAQESQRLMEEIARLDAGDSALSLKLDQLSDTLEDLKTTDGGEALEALQQRLQADRARLAEIERSIEEQVALSRSLQGAADAMHSRLLAAESGLSRVAASELDAGRDLDLAEVDYLLRLANERLALFADVAAADQALALAESHLAALDSPTYLGVRQEVAAARRDLARVEAPDFLQMAADLDALQGQIADLPFAGSPSGPGAASSPAEGSWWERLKSTLGGLVTIRRTTGDATLSLEDKDYVRQRLWLQLEMAHLALMRRDQPGFRTALSRAGETLDRWFDAGDPRLQRAMAALDELAAQDVEVDLPDITTPWNTLRLLRAAGPPPPSVPVSAADPQSTGEADPEADPGDDSP